MNPEAITQAGSVGVAIVALWVLYKINANHLEHAEKTDRLFSEAIHRLSDAIAVVKEKL